MVIKVICKILFLKALRFIFCWTEEMTSVKFCEKHLKFCNNTVNDWNNYLRKVYVISLREKESKKLEEKEKQWKLTKVCSLNIKIIVEKYSSSNGFSVEYVVEQRRHF